MEGGGAERVSAVLSNYWVGQGHEVVLMPTFSLRGECAYPMDERVRLIYLADRVGSTHQNIRTYIKRFFSLKRFILEFQPHVIVSFLTHVNIAALLAAFGTAIPVVVSERSYPPMVSLPWYWKILRRLTYPFAKAVVMQTGQGCDWLRANSPRVNALVIPNPVVYPLPLCEPYVSPKEFLKVGRQVVLAVGRLGKEKGFDTLIRAFAMLASDFVNWDVVILGEGKERPYLEKLVKEHGLTARVYFPGYVGNLAEWYEFAELYVLSSRFEGFPNTLLEAMAYGVPAVSMDCATGPRDIIRHERDGLLVSMGEGEEGLANAMRRLMTLESMRHLMSEHAKEIRERYSIAKISALWNEVLELG
jgi:GalNAc-alpha-(1->4)-GalNAc-alpha-(1->3)-diNAcBac-PP-undecaprenol alpha-1,4-N-acetyl-D-galactosaminyltransferase